MTSLGGELVGGEVTLLGGELVVRWFLGGKLVGGETPWWRDDQ